MAYTIAAGTAISTREDYEVLRVRADAHRQAALDDEQSIADLGDPATKAHIRRLVIEGYWGAAFHWIAYGCERKHAKHKEQHAGLVRFLRDLSENTVADQWKTLEDVRIGGWYGQQTALVDVTEAQLRWQEIRTWALS